MWFLQPGLTFTDLILKIMAILIITFLVLPLHEFAKAWVAYQLGDDTAKNEGSLTLNPLAHFSASGAICMLLFNFGWSKPVTINPNNFENPHRDMAFVALAGPIANILASLVGGVLLNFTPFIPSVNVICLMRKMTNDTIKAQRTNKKQRYSISCWIKVGVWINRFSLIVSFEAIY